MRDSNQFEQFHENFERLSNFKPVKVNISVWRLKNLNLILTSQKGLEDAKADPIVDRHDGQ